MRLTYPHVSIPALAVYGLAILFANILIRSVGTLVLPDGTHLLPVGFGLYAPSGVFAVGLTFAARDVVQRCAGRKWSLLIIIPGAILTAFLNVQLALASATAFLFSESVDYLVYTPLQRRGFVRAVIASGIVASMIDSLIFLVIAGIPLSIAFWGQLLGKTEMLLIAAPLTWLLRRWLPALGSAQTE